MSPEIMIQEIKEGKKHISLYTSFFNNSDSLKHFLIENGYQLFHKKTEKVADENRIILHDLHRNGEKLI